FKTLLSRAMNTADCHSLEPAIRRLGFATTIALTLAACASAPMTVEITREHRSEASGPAFPTATELNQLAARPAPVRIEGHGMEVPTWQLTGPFPDSVDIVPAT